MGASIEIVQPALFAGVVADEVVASVQDSILDHGHCSLVLAGGRTPGAIYRMLAIPPRVDEIEWDKVRIYFTDERWVPRDHHQSNYRMVDETLLSRLPRPVPKVFSVDPSLPSPEAAAEGYVKLIRDAENIKAEDLPAFDLVLLGIGTDGHTASVFPGCPVQDGKIAYATHDQQGEKRVTLSPDALFQAKRIIFIATGDHKADIVKRVLESEEDPAALPARLYTKVQEKVSFFLGSNAAKKLEKVKA